MGYSLQAKICNYCRRYCINATSTVYNYFAALTTNLRNYVKHGISSTVVFLLWFGQGAPNDKISELMLLILRLMSLPVVSSESSSLRKMNSSESDSDTISGSPLTKAKWPWAIGSYMSISLALVTFDCGGQFGELLVNALAFIFNTLAFSIRLVGWSLALEENGVLTPGRFSCLSVTLKGETIFNSIQVLN